MRYTIVIQELKAGGNPNVLAFLRDVEKIRKLTSKERHYLLENRQMPHAIDRLVKDFIPYIIKTAYGFSRYTNSLSVLDLINEGVFGAHAALNRRSGSGRKMTRYIDSYIKFYIGNAINRAKEQRVADYVYEVNARYDDEPQQEKMINEINREWDRLFLTDMIQENMKSRDGKIILEYYLGGDDDLNRVAKKYELSRERVRQIVSDFTSLYKKMENIRSIRNTCFA